MNRSDFLWLARFYKKYWGIVLFLVVMTPLYSMVNVFVPRLFGYTIDTMNGNGDSLSGVALAIADRGAGFGLTPAQSFAATFFLLGSSTFVFYACLMSTRAWMNCRLEWLFRQDAFNRLTTKGPDFFRKFATGDLVTRMTDDVAEKLSWFACSGIFRLYEATIGILFIVAMMLSIDPWLTLFTAGPLPVLILIFFRSGKLLDDRYDALQKSISRVNDVMEACFYGVRVVKAYAREDAQAAKFDRVAEARRDAEVAAVKMTTIIDSLYNYIWQFGVVIVLFAGGYRVVQNELTVGEMATFIYYVVWLVFPMFDVGQFLVKSRQSGVSIHRLRDIERIPAMVERGFEGMDENDVVVGGAHASGGTGAPAAGAGAAAGTTGPAIAFENIKFGFDGEGRRKILDIDELRIAEGETIALVGRVGAGKTWLVNLLPRVVDVDEGLVTIAGRDVRDYDITELRSMLGYVPQDPVLFSDTVRNNIVFGRAGISDERIEWALEISRFLMDVERFPRGLETMIGTRGLALSGGQKQRLSLARALVTEPRVLILDDCTSALDAQTERLLWDRLHEVMPGRTALLVTHRPDTLRRVDRIFVMSEGRVVERGTHDELMAGAGEYASIYHQYELMEKVGEAPPAEHDIA
ncbi:MAG: ABC transporter ATP-binding protein [Gemmatimonadetes bacterium]|nr:ABC transporter ATP-binding protein [Gemmatimonadota bacterium]